MVPVPPLVDLDLPSKPPPPLTSFTGFRSRIMASFMSFLTRRQADRTTSMFGICVFMLKPPPQLFRRNLLARSPGESKPKSCLIACVKAARIINRPLPSVRSHPREADGRTDSVHFFSADCSRTPSIHTTADGNRKTPYLKLSETLRETRWSFGSQ